MKNILFALMIIGIHTLRADIPKFDIVTIKIQDSIFYMRVGSKGVLYKDDLNYYDYNKNIRSNVDDELERIITPKSKIDLYRTLEEINISKLERYFSSETILYIPKNKKVILGSELIGKYKIISANNGNTYGYTFSKELKTTDSYWIEDYEIEKLFDFHDGELCEMKLYGIKGNLLLKEIAEIKTELENAYKEHNRKKVEIILARLYRRNIIMIGFCSC